VKTPWFLSSCRGRPEFRVVCFPHAGGNPAAFMHWSAHLPENVELVAVQYPGRGGHVARPPHRDLEALVDELADVAAALLDRPTVLLGHSLGAVVAYEVARRFRDEPNLRHLFVSGCLAPAYWPPPEGKRLGQLSAEAFAAALRERGAFPEAVFEHASLRDYVVAVAKADYEMIASYSYVKREPLAVPITAFAGRDDGEAPLDGMDAWADESRGPISFLTFPGEHLFVYDHVETVAPILVDRLSAS
jgi:surfactin synthase thioesterase subunit